MMRSMITRKERPPLVSIALGTTVALAVTISLCAIFAKLLVQETIRQEWSGYVCFAILLAASFLGAVSAQLKAHKRALACFGAGGAYFAILLSIGTIGFHQGVNGIGASAIVIACGSAVAMMSWMPKGRRRTVSRRFRNG